ncbi:MAG: hypothetical protein KF809_15800 [Chloroflexi bacterium]|nr:hypothetical protein [Chloroflexota bacterium]
MPAAPELTRQGVAQDDTIQLTIETERERFHVDEEIAITTLVRALGDGPIEMGVSRSGLVAFAIEQLDGPIRLGARRRASCGRQRLQGGEVMEVPFRVTAADDPDDLAEAEMERILSEPDLRLPMGTYRITAHARYGDPECASPRSLKTSIVIAVGLVQWDAVPLPIQVLECDGRPSSTGRDLNPGDVGGSGPDPATVVLTTMQDGDLVAPWSGYEAIAADEDTMLFVYRAGGRVKTAVLLQEGVPPLGSGWRMIGFRRCLLEELGPDVDLGPDWRIWAHPDGRILGSRRNSGHCGWERVWSLLYQRDPQVDYVRDPEHRFRKVVPVPYATGVRLPRGARDTGYRRGGAQLWMGPRKRAVFVVRADGVVERWPRVIGGVVCGG